MIGILGQENGDIKMITNLMRYTPEIREIKSESEVSNVLFSLRANLSLINKKYSYKSLKDILEIVKIGKEIIHREGSPIQEEINLSEIRKILSNYRKLSEGGCYSCIHLHLSKPYSDETNFYCQLKETEEDIDERTGKSPCVRRYEQDDSCLLIKRRFKKIEDIIFAENIR